MADHEMRKVVTVVFCDLVRSTALGEELDPETFGDVVNRYHELADVLLREHGGSVQKFIGDAVVAVFGVPILHEDDALRAVTAASKLGPAIIELNQKLDKEVDRRLGVRIGVNTGEVLVKDSPDGQSQVLGETVNVAARLEQVAGSREILIGDQTYQLVRDVVDAEPLDALALPGHTVPVDAWRLLAVHADARDHARRTSAPLVGRLPDLALLEAAFERVVAERRCHLVTVLGEAGVGKTRLIDEFTGRLGDRATVLQGRCRSYGEGITYWPVARMIRQSAGILDDDPAGIGFAKLTELVGEDSGLTTRLACLIGIREGSVEPEDTYWTLLRFLSLLARRPLVLVIDDLQWAQPDLIELVDHIAQWSLNSPLLLVCCARSDLRAGLHPNARNAVDLELSPLTDSQTQELVGHILHKGRVTPALRSRLAEAAAGYPLFVEELLGMLLDDSTLRLVDGHWTISSDLADIRLPVTMHAVLAARLDELSEVERLLLGRAAVVGSQFPTAAVAELSSDRDRQEVRATLTSLARRQLLHPDLTAEAPRRTYDRFRFRHALIRDAAYQSLSKEARGELHQRYANWLERTTPSHGAAIDEMIGFHLEAAYRLRVELNRPASSSREMARMAGERLAAAGHALAVRGDVPDTAVDLLERAVALLPDDHERRIDTLLDLAGALRDAERLGEALDVFQQAGEAAGTTGDARRAAHATLGRLELVWFTRPSELTDGGGAAIEVATRVLEDANDNLGLAKALRLSAYVDFACGRARAARKCVERAIGIARYLADERLEAQLLRLHCVILFWGPAPLDEVVVATERALKRARERGMRVVEAAALSTLARVAAMRGEFEQARSLNESARTIATEFVDGMTWAAGFVSEGLVELLAGDLEVAEKKLRRAYERTTRAGGTGPAASLAALLARTHLEQGRDDDALAMAKACRKMSSKAQLDMRLKPRSVRAVVLARNGRLRAAERLARRVVAAAGHSEQIDSQVDAWYALAQVLTMAGHEAEAREAAEEALERCRAKGNKVSAETIGAFLDGLGATSAA